MRVLLVEDHPALAQISSQLLSEVHGHDVRHAPTGEAALATLREFHPDLVLLDLNLPDMHGYRLAETLRMQPEFDDTIIVALTGFGLAGDPRMSAATGIDAHYRKPMNFSELEGIPRLPHAPRPAPENPAPGRARWVAWRPDATRRNNRAGTSPAN